MINSTIKNGLLSKYIIQFEQQQFPRILAVV